MKGSNLSEEIFKSKGAVGVMERAQILEGRTFAKAVRTQLKIEVAEFISQSGYTPGLAIVLVGDDPSSIAYTRTLTKTAIELGFYAIDRIYPASTSVKEYQTALAQLNADPRIHGVTVQWPTPPQLSFETVTNALDPRKDVDGLHPLTVGRLFCQLDTFAPPTPLGGMRLLDYYGFSVAGKSCLLVGTGVTVGRPLLALLHAAQASVMAANNNTPRETLLRYAAQADFIFTAAGAPGLLTGEMVKPGVVVVDFGTSFVEDRLVGDTDFESLLPVARAITPTPGGTGPVTNVMLLSNVLKAAKRGMNNAEVRMQNAE